MTRVFYHTDVLDVTVNPEKPWMKSEAVPESNRSVPQVKSRLGGLMMEEINRIFSQELDNFFNRGTNRDCKRFEGLLEEEQNPAFSKPRA